MTWIRWSICEFMDQYDIVEQVQGSQVDFTPFYVLLCCILHV